MIEELVSGDAGQVLLGFIGALLIAIVLAFAIALWALWKSMD